MRIRVVLPNLIAPIGWLLLPSLIFVYFDLVNIHPDSGGTDDTKPLFILLSPILYVLVAAYYFAITVKSQNIATSLPRRKLKIIVIYAVSFSCLLVLYKLTKFYLFCYLGIIAGFVLLGIFSFLISGLLWTLVAGLPLTQHSSGTTKVAP